MKPIETRVASPETTLNAARVELERHGGSLTGDLTAGDIVAKTPVGDVIGRYTVEGDLLTVHIVEKPRLAPGKVLRGVVAKFFEDQAG